MPPRPTLRRNELSEQAPTGSDFDNPLESSGRDIWVREVALAAGLVVLLLGSLWISTGSFPPMVVVESSSMMHDEEGEIGSIDPGDLILVMDPERVDVVTYAEATEEGNDNYGYESHGLPGDVIIYRKNGGQGTPVIHRALLQAVQNGSGWDVPGTTLRNVQTVSVALDYECSAYHGGTFKLEIEDWEPQHSGFLTSGDNNFGGCMVDQPSANSQGQGGGLTDDRGSPVLPVKQDWIVGVASSEIPWIGSIKLLTSGTADSVTARSWSNLTIAILLILASPVVFEQLNPGTNSREEEE
ncbi:MAG: hypothetical protein CMB67_03675 [Euryarchaeota archaeon]|nr:hypothetical protein [Euryarchaeota archaeon]